MWISLIVSNSGTWLQSTVQDQLVYSMTGRALDLGWVNGARAAALIMLPFFGGTLVDRIDKRRILITTQTLFALFAVLLGWLVQTGGVRVWHIVVLSFFNAALLAVDQPARQALLPQLVPKPEFMNAIALNSITFVGAAALGPALAGPVVRWFGVGASFYVNAASFGAVIWAVWLLDLTPRASSHRSALRELEAGMRYLASSRALLLIVSVLTAYSFFALPYQALLPVFVGRVFHPAAGTRALTATGVLASRDVALLGYMRSAAGVGALLGGLMVARWSHHNGKGTQALRAAVILSAALLAFCATRSISIALVCLLAAGVLQTVISATVQTLMQHLTTDEMRGRVMSLYSISVVGMQPLGALPLAWAADRLGAGWALAAGVSVACCYALSLAVLGRDVIRRLDGV